MSASTKLEYVMYRLLRKTLTKIDLNTGTEFKAGVRGANSHNEELLDILKRFCFRFTFFLVFSLALEFICINLFYGDLKIITDSVIY